MKKFLLFIISILISVSAYSDCIIQRGFSFWPSNKIIKKNPIFIMNGNKEDVNILYGLNEKYPIYLQSGNQKIKLEVLDILVSDGDKVQAFLKPEKFLTGGLNYTLIIEN